MRIFIIINQEFFNKKAIPDSFHEQHEQMESGDTVSDVTLCLPLPGTDDSKSIEKALSNDNIAELVILIHQYFPNKQIVRFNRIEWLNQNIALKLLKNINLLKYLTDKDFLALIIFSDDTVKYALSIPEVRERLEHFGSRIDSDLFEVILELSNENIVELLKIKKLMDCLDDKFFLDLIVSSEEAAKYALSNPDIRERLDRYNPGINNQTFDNSCAARCILTFLATDNLLSKQEVTRSKELEIYSQIWTSPGQMADPERMMKYLIAMKTPTVKIDKKSENGLSTTNEEARPVFDVSGFESQVRVAKWLEEKPPLYKYAYQLFKAVPAVDIHKIKTEAKLDENDFPVGITILLVVNRTFGCHILFGKKMSGGTFEVTDPNNGEKTKYDSIEQYLERDEDFLGVGYKLTLRKTS